VRLVLAGGNGGRLGSRAEMQRLHLKCEICLPATWECRREAAIAAAWGFQMRPDMQVMFISEYTRSAVLKPTVSEW
jgi:hypothetical protein